MSPGDSGECAIVNRDLKGPLKWIMQTLATLVQEYHLVL